MHVQLTENCIILSHAHLHLVSSSAVKGCVSGRAELDLSVGIKSALEVRVLLPHCLRLFIPTVNKEPIEL